ncbi:DUF6289 family protein [Longispora albida]|uniref:DUF6289 family protein n=1 Tax=Longispora albida TaxID=203523 RepID=UPI00036974DC|nr:DUF6289 family protein [Longispora albida]
MIRRGLLAVAVAAGLLVATAAPAAALPVHLNGYQYNLYYYADSARTQIVGGYTIFCDRSRADFGTTSRYTSVTQIKCGVID